MGKYLVFLGALVLLTTSIKAQDIISLPSPSFKGKISVEEAIKARRTNRDFGTSPLNLNQLSQILWAAYGITGKDGFKKSVPSAGALYPMDIIIVVGKKAVIGLKEGVYLYNSSSHALIRIKNGDKRKDLAKACLYQMWIAEAPVVIVMIGVYERCTKKYGKRGVRYTHIEAGHIGQNIFLQTEALGLKAGIVGAFSDEEIKKILNLKQGIPLLVMPIGHP